MFRDTSTPPATHQGRRPGGFREEAGPAPAAGWSSGPVPVPGPRSSADDQDAWTLRRCEVASRPGRPPTGDLAGSTRKPISFVSTLFPFGCQETVVDIAVRLVLRPRTRKTVMQIR